MSADYRDRDDGIQRERPDDRDDGIQRERPDDRDDAFTTRRRRGSGSGLEGDLPKKLGKLSTKARKKKLSTLRGILVVVGLLTIGVNAVMMAITTRESIIKEAKVQLGPNVIINQDAVDEILRLNQIICGSAIFLGVVFLVLAVFVHQYPVPISILSLVLYVGAALVFAAISGDPKVLFQGLIFKIIIIVCMAQAIQTAIALEKDRREKDDELAYE